MNNNEKFAKLLNNCQNPEAMCAALLALAKSGVEDLAQTAAGKVYELTVPKQNHQREQRAAPELTAPLPDPDFLVSFG